MVREERLELSRLAALEPKSSASTNSATLAKSINLNNRGLYQFSQLIRIIIPTILIAQRSFNNLKLGVKNKNNYKIEFPYQNYTFKVT